MKSNNEKILNLICILIILISLSSYEIHLYKFYSVLQIIVLGLSIMLIFLTNKYEGELVKSIQRKMNRNLLMIIMFFLMILNTIIANLHLLNNPLNILSVLGMFFTAISVYIYIPSIVKKYPNIKTNIFLTLNYFCVLLVIIGLFIYIKGNFLNYSLIYGRAASIYYDPNFLAMVLAINLILELLNERKHNIFKYILFFLSFVLIILTGSRGTLIGLIISLLSYIFIFSNYKLVKKTLISILICIATYFLINYLTSVDFFRIYQGSNGRIEMISYIYKLFKQSPIFGYGYSNVGLYLVNAGFANVSTHNSFVDFLFAFGLIPTILFVILIFQNFIIAFKNKECPELVVSLVFIVFNMNTILYNFGGVGISSILFTLILGLINEKGSEKTNEET